MKSALDRSLGSGASGQSPSPSKGGPAMTKLETAKVVLDPQRRKDIIETEAKNLAFAQGLELVDDAGLLDEVAGLVEWPVVLVGRFDEKFLELPDEVIRLTIRANQKCFVLKDPSTGALSNRFVAVSNIEAPDAGRTIIAGNEKVIHARLSDAWFFWETDLKAPLESRLPKLDNVIFHEKLGTQGERVQRLTALARALAPAVGADPDAAARAARLAKADLPTQMVYEFPELQGQIGRTYAELQGEDTSVSLALEDHYRPQGPSDDVPSDPVAIAVAIADKLDLLTGFWAIDEKPTGSKDPFALRRAALGVLRIVLENGLRLRLREWFATANPLMTADGGALGDDLLAFVADRLKGHLKDEGARHDLIDAVFALDDQDDLLMVVKRVEALGTFLASEDGANLLAGSKRGANILRAEEKKDGRAVDGVPHADHLIEPAEIALAAAIDTARAGMRDALAKEDFEAAMTAMAALRAPVDRFFDDILVNAEDADLRLNRLRLLAEIREATRTVADFSKIAG